MVYASVCSGIGGATVAWGPLGWKAAWFSEVAPFQCIVLKHHYPDVLNLGDMTKLHEREEFQRRPIDLMVAGTPCTSFSGAGLRQGLDHPDGQLALVYLKLVGLRRPQWCIWENVPGALLTHRGRDFGTILGTLAKLGYGWAYRILDARFFGVPQRRRRVFVVGYFGDWRPAAAVLLEPASGAGNPDWSQEDWAEAESPSAKRPAISFNHQERRNFAEFSEMTNPLVSSQTQAVLVASSGGDISRDAKGDPRLSARRLTPLESERLQGFPDNYTLIPWRGGTAPDGPRYEALGNSFAVPVLRWLGQRIDRFEEMTARLRRGGHGARRNG